jgi:hypothetical protein
MTPLQNFDHTFGIPYTEDLPGTSFTAPLASGTPEISIPPTEYDPTAGYGFDPAG